MAENTGAAEGQDPNATQPQGGASQEPPQSQAGSADTEQAPDPQSLQRELSDTRREAARYRVELRKFQEAAKAAEEAALPERERLQRRVSELEQEHADFDRERKDLRLREAVVSAASRLGYIDPQDAYRYLDASTVTFDDDGRPQDLEKSLKEIIDRKPYLASAGTTPSITRGVQPGPSSGGGFNDIIRRATGVTR